MERRRLVATPPAIRQRQPENLCPPSRSGIYARRCSICTVCR
ncbi:hypothetical protein [Kingella oralis]|nr:hypothetical protein [Kingella oralis]